jgi:DNA-binding PadR family transcriptional regulator
MNEIERIPHDLSAFQRDVLATIAALEEANDDRPHGLGVADELASHYGETINHGRLYPNLDKLVEKGLVNKSERNGRCNGYQLTGRGESTLRAYARWVATAADLEVSDDG